ncbi:peptidase, partial [Porticoccaceae bacterium]|nr:peptidase [Porticoccaceae bacterium]
ILIGDVTRGKPYGFYGIDNCSTTYFTIQFKGSNAKGFGDYSDGLIPADTDDMSGAQVRGCYVDDDLDHVLGDENEAQFAAALSYIETGACNVAAGGSNKVSSRSAGTASRVPGDLKPPTLPGRILQSRR